MGDKVSGAIGSGNSNLKNLLIVWHRSRVIFTFDSTYPYNTVKAFFWKARRGDFENWVFDEKKMKVLNIESKDAKEIQFKNGLFIYRRQTSIDQTIIEVSEFEKKSVFQVILTGDPDQADDEIREFLSILHRNIDLSRAEKRLIYSEQFIRYNEQKEHEVRKAITTLYKLFGISLTEKRQKSEQIDVVYLCRAMLSINDNIIHIKTYRPKEYKTPAQSIYDHPKLEATVYYEKSKLDKRELEQLARDLIVTIAQHTGLYDYVVSPGWNFNYPIAGTGRVNLDILKALRVENLKFKIETLDNTEKSLRNEKARRIVEFIAKNGGKTSKEIAKELGLNERTVRYHLKKLKDDDIISNCRRSNRHFYHIHVSI